LQSLVWSVFNYRDGFPCRINRQAAPDAARAKWRDELGRNRSAKLDAPGWLWTSIVELVASHEAAYLEHCRRYAADPELAA
jgi:uncharacterized protein (DUF2252 family)